MKTLKPRLMRAPPPALSASAKHSLRRRRSRKMSPTSVASTCGVAPLPKTDDSRMNSTQAGESNDWMARASRKSHAK
jgi:hypothetical protein